MESKSVISRIIRCPTCLLLLLFTWKQCSSDSDLREFQANLSGFVSIHIYYGSSQEKDLVNSWCRQVSTSDCADIVDTKGRVSNFHRGRVSISQIQGKTNSVTVNMTELQVWDTGLYKWRTWTGKKYNVMQSVLLQVVEGIPSNLKVVRAPADSAVEMICSYNQQQKWSKIWCKQMDSRRCDWVAHSDGSTNTDYKGRPLVSNDQQARVMTMTLTQLEHWDSGLYRCRESGGQTNLEEVLLIVTADKAHTNEVVQIGTSKASSLTSLQSTEPTPHLPHVHPDRANIHPFGLITTTSSGHLDSSRASVPPRLTVKQHRAWDIMRWLLFLAMVLFCLIFNYYKCVTGFITRICQVPRRSKRFKFSI